jgi:hypothetical protein
MRSSEANDTERFGVATYTNTVPWRGCFKTRTVT